MSRHLILGSLLIGCLTAGNGQAQQIALLDALRTALTNHPQLKLQQAQIEISKGAKDIASGAFDYVVQSGLQQNVTTPAATVQGIGELTVLGQTELINQTQFSANASKLYRSGVSISPYFDSTRTTDSFLYPTGLNDSSAGLSISVPLLRGRGAKVVAARERAADMEIHASQFDFDYLLSSLANTVAQDYWAFVAASQSLDVAVEAEQRGQHYVDNTKALIDADNVPRSDLNQVSANLAQRTSARIAAENQLVVARQNLAHDMGLKAEAILDSLGAPADTFPIAPDTPDTLNSTATPHQYLTMALAQRADYRAAVNRREQSQILLPAAQNGLLPEVNLAFTGGYQGIHIGRSFEDLVLSPFAGVRGPTASAGIAFSYPVGNHTALGVLRQAVASAQQTDISAQEVARTISTAVTIALDNTRSAILRVQKAQIAVDLAQDALTGVREKYRVGRGSIVEVLQSEDLLNGVLGDQVTAKYSYAVALVNLRFSLGILVPSDQQVPIIRKEAFTELVPLVITQ